MNSDLDPIETSPFPTPVYLDTDIYFPFAFNIPSSQQTKNIEDAKLVVLGFVGFGSRTAAGWTEAVQNHVTFATKRRIPVLLWSPGDDAVHEIARNFGVKGSSGVDLNEILTREQNWRGFVPATKKKDPAPELMCNLSAILGMTVLFAALCIGIAVNFKQTADLQEQQILILISEKAQLELANKKNSEEISRINSEKLALEIEKTQITKDIVQQLTQPLSSISYSLLVAKREMDKVVKFLEEGKPTREEDPEAHMF